MPLALTLARAALAAFTLTLLAACGHAPTAPSTAPIDLALLQQQVADTERAFARTMAERDHAAFTRFLADEAVFFGGSAPLRGKAAVAAAWRRYFEASAAPFSWEPAQVQVLDSGTLALSTGPVYDAQGKQVASFTSVWRLQAPGVWRIVFDKGCNCAP